ncbi:MAG: SDR family NAD(P)-dependent oxidoreductase [Deltaproteobacteria bacterium]|nr:SDR family NAD(P)-dependent oxidoreductase [Deltaproteobacteria bacterium]
MIPSWENRIVYITGASSGLGEGLALALARCGARLGLVARRRQLLEQLAAQVEAEQARAAIATCDVGDRAAVEQAFGQLEQQLGPPDVLILSAGCNRFMSIEHFDAAVAEQILRTNLLGALYCIGAVLPGMLQRGAGHIVGVSSVSGFRGVAGSGPYSASKAGLSMLLESLRADLAPHGIAVTAVHPGFVRTPMTAGHRFPMPFLVERERAVVIMLRGIERRRRQIDFPWPMVWALRLARLLPAAVWEWIGRLLNRRYPPRRRAAG